MTSNNIILRFNTEAELDTALEAADEIWGKAAQQIIEAGFSRQCRFYLEFTDIVDEVLLANFISKYKELCKNL